MRQVEFFYNVKGFMNKLIFLIFCCLLIIFAYNNECLTVESEQEKELRTRILSSLSSGDLLKFDQFRCVYHIKFGYSSSIEEALQKGVTDLLGEYHAVWNKSGATELLDIRDVTSRDNQTVPDRSREYNLMFDYCFLTDGKMSMLFDYNVGQGNLASTQHIERPDTNLPLTPDSYIYIQDIVEYLTDSFLIEKVKVLKNQNLPVNKINVNLKQEHDTILISVESDPVNDWAACVIEVDRTCGYLPKKLISGRGKSFFRYIFISDYFRFGDSKFFPKKVLEIQPDYKQISDDRYEIRTDRFCVREFEVSVFDPDSEFKSSDFEIVLPRSVRIFDAANDKSSGYSGKKSDTIAVSALASIYRKIQQDDLESKYSPVQHFQFSGFWLRVFLVIIGIFCIILGCFLNHYYNKS
jgi:hypothetical protein